MDFPLAINAEVSLPDQVKVVKKYKSRVSPADANAPVTIVPTLASSSTMRHHRPLPGRRVQVTSRWILAWNGVFRSQSASAVDPASGRIRWAGHFSV